MISYPTLRRYPENRQFRIFICTLHVRRSILHWGIAISRICCQQPGSHIPPPLSLNQLVCYHRNKKQIHDRHFPSLKLSQRSRRENIRLRLENLWCYRPPGSPGRSNDRVVHPMICTDGDQILVNSRAQIKSGSCRPNPPTGACLRNQLALLAAERFGDEGELE